MKIHDTTIVEFLGNSNKQFVIPIYQRAYSWDKKELNAFLEDLNEASEGSNQYFFGNVLLEEINNEENGIIDGQQRVSTIIIFARALYNVLKHRDDVKEKENFLKYLEEDFLIKRNKPKLKAVEYDSDYFNDFIILNNENKHNPQTPSQERIKKAKEFFIKNLDKIETNELLKIYNVLTKAKILSITFNNKKDSVLMFELQNNRGKKLTNMEKLKSYLAYQIYTYSDNEKDAENKLKEMTKIFEEIYCKIDNTGFKEDEVLNWFNFYYSKFGFSYRENDDEKNYKKELKDKKPAEKVQWIFDYVRELKNAFINIGEFKKMDSISKDYLCSLNVKPLYPFILKAYNIFQNNKEKIEKVAKLLEIIAFRHRLIRTGASLNSRLDSVIKKFDSLDSLFENLKDICSSEKVYWRDDAIKNSLVNIYNKKDDDSQDDETVKVLPYLFMRYENFLRSKETLSKDYPYSLKELVLYPQIEHIAPQTENDEKIASGYCEYDEEFKEQYLNCVGNLMLIGRGHNIIIGNKPFAEKLESYKNSNTTLSQQKEISNFIVNNGQWDKDAIDKRHEALEKFVLDTWSFKEG